jgi:hypothetical protein
MNDMNLFIFQVMQDVSFSFDKQTYFSRLVLTPHTKNVDGSSSPELVLYTRMSTRLLGKLF